MTRLEAYPILYSIINRIAQGTPPFRAFQEHGVTRQWFRGWIERDPELQRLHEQAKEDQAETLTEILLTINQPTDPRDPLAIGGETDAKMAKVISDNIKWYAEKLKPEKYSSRMEIKHTVTADGVITQMLRAGMERISQLKTIDAEYTEVVQAREPALLPAPDVEEAVRKLMYG
jgi:hypothetical protein